ncbi:MAG: hypothetical protein HY527_21065 [Betaproteobacteria bacterium]|nr:hypothetical protein [Betaproteobacteria bacterium]
MTKLGMVMLLGTVALASAAANAQTNVRVRGTITAVDGNVLAVKARDGKDLTLHMTEKTTVAAAKAITLADLKAGDYVGSTAMKGPDDALVAREVHTIARSVREGHGPWDLEPGSTMTNANVATVVKASSGHELTLEYKGGSQKILVPPGTPIVTTVPADRSFLKPGEYIFTAASVDADGKMTALRIQVSKDGVRPPQ